MASSSSSVLVHDIDHLSDDEQHQAVATKGRGPPQQGPVVAKRRPGKRREQKVLAVNKPPDIRGLRQKIQGACGCQCECFLPFRDIHVFEKLLKVRTELAALEKLEQDQYAWPSPCQASE